MEGKEKPQLILHDQTDLGTASSVEIRSRPGRDPSELVTGATVPHSRKHDEGVATVDRRLFPQADQSDQILHPPQLSQPEPLRENIEQSDTRDTVESTHSLINPASEVSKKQQQPDLLSQSQQRRDSVAPVTRSSSSSSEEKFEAKLGAAYSSEDRERIFRENREKRRGQRKQERAEARRVERALLNERDKGVKKVLQYKEDITEITKLYKLSESDNVQYKEDIKRKEKEIASLKRKNATLMNAVSDLRVNSQLSTPIHRKLVADEVLKDNGEDTTDIADQIVDRFGDLTLLPDREETGDVIGGELAIDSRVNETDQTKQATPLTSRKMFHLTDTVTQSPQPHMRTTKSQSDIRIPQDGELGEPIKMAQSQPALGEYFRRNECYTQQFECLVCLHDRDYNMCRECGRTPEKHPKHRFKPRLKDDKSCKDCGPLESHYRCHQFKSCHPIDSHVCPECVLRAVCGNHAVIWSAQQQKQKNAANLHFQLFCKVCDRSTARMENIFKETFFVDRPSKCPKISGEELANLLHIFTFRGLLVNVCLNHYQECHNCKQYYDGIMSFIHKAHEISSSPNKDLHGDLLDHHTTEAKEDRFFEFPFICDIDLTSIELGHCPMIFAQFPPVYWAHPLDPRMTEKLQQYFPAIIKTINDRLHSEHERYFKSNGAARVWRNNLKTLSLRPKLLIRYLPDCCLQISADLT